MHRISTTSLFKSHPAHRSKREKPQFWSSSLALAWVFFEVTTGSLAVFKQLVKQFCRLLIDPWWKTLITTNRFSLIHSPFHPLTLECCRMKAAAVPAGSSHWGAADRLPGSAFLDQLCLHCSQIFLFINATFHLSHDDWAFHPLVRSSEIVWKLGFMSVYFQNPPLNRPL